MHTLIVEDDLELAEILQCLMEMKGIDAEYLRDGAVALEYLTHVIPDLVILDLHLPNVSGLDILTHLKADSRFQHTRVVIATGDVSQVRKLNGMTDAVLVKPFLYDELVGVTEHLFVEA